jgi:hypothetical protein
VHGDQQLGMDYWIERNFNTATDTSISALKGPSDSARAALMQDATLAALHDGAVRWRKTRFEELMRQEPMRALFARLLMAPPSRLVNASSARTLRQFATDARAEDQQ